jgi:hypothetical protein
MFIKNPNAKRIRASRPMAKDRQTLDFSRFLIHVTADGGPVPGISYLTMLRIATEVCGREITELTQVKTKAELKRIAAKVKELKKGG